MPDEFSRPGKRCPSVATPSAETLATTTAVDVSLYVAVEKSFGKTAKVHLELIGLYDSKRKAILSSQEGTIKLLLPVVSRAKDVLFECLVPPDSHGDNDIAIELVELQGSCHRASKRLSPLDELTAHVRDLLSKPGALPCEPLLAELPKRWEKHGDIVLFPRSAFVSDFWKGQGCGFWRDIACMFKANRVGIMGAVLNDAYRTPRVELLLGDDGWTEHIDNGVVYCFDVTKCMFSSGNVTEKLRVSSFSCHGETVVDLFAGIGYFTLPYLVHTNAALVHACEWNPDAVDALRRGLRANCIAPERCIIHEGNNAELCPVGVADRVNLGLLPSSREAWPVACRALKSTGGILHIHENVSVSPRGRPTPATSEEDGAAVPCPDSVTVQAATSEKERQHWAEWAAATASNIREMLQTLHSSSWEVDVLGIHRVKSYAPHVTHMVLDAKCLPTTAATSS